MAIIRTVEELDALYDVPVPTSIIKEVDHLTPLHREYVAASPFVLIASSGPGGLDCSPRGDPAGFVRVVDERTLMIPDRRGNNRLDTIRNLVLDPRIALLFLIPGIGMTLRVNGTAVVTTDQQLRESFTFEGKVPTTVVIVTTEAVYTQCPKALIRSSLWDPACCIVTRASCRRAGRSWSTSRPASSTVRRTTRHIRGECARRSTDAAGDARSRRGDRSGSTRAPMSL